MTFVAVEHDLEQPRGLGQVGLDKPRDALAVSDVLEVAVRGASASAVRVLGKAHLVFYHVVRDGVATHGVTQLSR